MIARTWRTRIDMARLEEWDRFVRERSTPMFRLQDGVLAVFHARDGDEWLTVSIWRDAPAVEWLDSQSYTTTAGDLLATGMVLRDPVTEAFEVSSCEISELVAALGLMGAEQPVLKTLLDRLRAVSRRVYDYNTPGYYAFYRLTLPQT